MFSLKLFHVEKVNMEAKAVQHLVKAMLLLSDFQPGRSSLEETTTYAKRVVAQLLVDSEDKEEFKDKLLSILANIKSLDGEINQTATGSEVNLALTPEEIAKMDAAEMRSAKEKREDARKLKKRLREQQNYDKTAMNCTRCGLVRRDRLNINQIGLDSDENGTQFDNTFGNVCECSDRSSSTSRSSSRSSSEEDKEATKMKME